MPCQRDNPSGLPGGGDNSEDPIEVLCCQKTGRGTGEAGKKAPDGRGLCASCGRMDLIFSPLGKLGNVLKR